MTTADRESKYEAFKASKDQRARGEGFDAPEIDAHPNLNAHQRKIVRWALGQGRAAIFADTGLGKSRMEIAIADEASRRLGCRALIFCPLAVAAQIVDEGAACGIEVSRDPKEGRIVVTNYDQLKSIDLRAFGVVLLDESSILKSFDGRMCRALIDGCRHTAMRFAFTATPAPNDHTEIGTHAEFLGVMTRTAMLTRWFVHDSMNTAEWRLKGHAADDFWGWVASWAVACRMPSDVGCPDDGYILPPLTIHRRIVEVPLEDANAGLFSDAALSATTLHKDKRRTSKERASEVARIVAAEPDEQWLVWCDADYEADDLMDAMRGGRPDVVEVRGSMKPQMKEDRLMGFARGDVRTLVTKPSIAGFGMNWQRCARVVFVGTSYSYEALYQAIRRCWRFGQAREVVVYVVSADSEWSVMESIETKREGHENMVREMVAAMRGAVGQGTEAEDDATADGLWESGKGWDLIGGDCVERMRAMPDHCLDFMVCSPPFASLYTYTDDPRDMGNVASDAEFFEGFGFMLDELARTLKPGRLASLHCMDLPMTKERDGAIGLRDFPGEIIRAMEARGFTFHSRVTIWKDPLVAMQRTKAIGLLHKQLCKDSSYSRQGIADYLITMRAPGDNPEPIAHPEGLTEYAGTEDPGGEATDNPATNKRSHFVWQRYASPVWMDIDPTDVLPYRGARAERDERHICPLQLTVIRRAIRLWSNPGDLVFSPFTGVGSEGYVALQEGRRFMGTELKRSYFGQAIRNLSRASQTTQLTLVDGLFDGEEGEEEALPLAA